MKHLTLIFFFYFFKVSDIIKIHRENGHEVPRHANIQISLDGIQENKSSPVSLDVYTMKFIGCKDIFPIKIIRPIVKNQLNHHTQLESVLNSIAANDLRVHSFICDNPKRAFIKNSMQHSAKFGCEYCFECGTQPRNILEEQTKEVVKKLSQQRRDIIQQIQNLNENDKDHSDYLKKILANLDEAEKLSKTHKKHSHIVWPSSTANGEPRTKEKIIEICEQLEAGEITVSEAKGVKGRSLLLDLEYFNFVLSIPTEYMHLMSLGVVKRLLELCFSVGESRQRITKRPLSSPELFNELMKYIKVPREFPRRARKLDLAVLKAHELRNIIIFYFLLITQCLGKNEKEINVWEMLAFMVRACILPHEEYENVNVNEIKYCQKHFYQCFEQLYGEKNCTYSVHVASSHLLDMKSSGPLTETSAFCFESFYAELRRAFVPGTVSVIKQMFQNVFLKRRLSKHVCEEKFFLRAKDTPLECNSLFYVYENNTHVIYKIKSMENDNITCNQMGNFEINLPCTNMLNWSSVGVYRKGGLSSADVIVKKNRVAGKVIKVDKYLVTCPLNILREK